MSDVDVTVKTPEVPEAPINPVVTDASPSITDALNRIGVLENTITEMRIEKERMEKWDEMSTLYQSQDFQALAQRMDTLEQKIVDLETAQIIDEEIEQDDTQVMNDDTSTIENAPIEEIPPIVQKSNDYFANRKKGLSRVDN